MNPELGLRICRKLGLGRNRKGITSAAVRSIVEALEFRQLLSIVPLTPATSSELIADINTANSVGGSNTITLTQGATYDFTAADNDWYGPDALPAITSNITIAGNGATIQRDSAGGTP